VFAATHGARIAAQLVRASDGSQLFAVTYDRSLQDVLFVQDDIALCVVQRISEELDIGSTAAAAPTGTPPDSFPPNLEAYEARHAYEAYDAYLKGMYAYRQWDKGGYEPAIDHFQRSVDLHPEFCPQPRGAGPVLYLPGFARQPGMVRGQ